MGGRGSKSKFAAPLMEPDQQQRNQGVSTPRERIKAVGQTDTALEQAMMNKLKQDIPWGQSLNTIEESALSAYQNTAYEDINDYLRTVGAGKPYVGSWNSSWDLKHINPMTDALDKASLPEGAIVYRGIKNRTMTLQEAQKLIGTMETDHGFGSTTLSAEMAQRWASHSYVADGTADKPFLSYRFTMTKGAKAAYILSATDPSAATYGAGGAYFHEYELLVQRGARYKITGVSQKVVNGKHYLFINGTYKGQQPNYNAVVPYV